MRIGENVLLSKELESSVTHQRIVVLSLRFLDLDTFRVRPVPMPLIPQRYHEVGVGQSQSAEPRVRLSRENAWRKMLRIADHPLPVVFPSRSDWNSVSVRALLSVPFFRRGWGYRSLGSGRCRSTGISAYPAAA